MKRMAQKAGASHGAMMRERGPKKPKEFPRFAVGDVVQNMDYGPMAEHRTVEAVGEQEHVLGFVRVSGLLGWHSARKFKLAEKA